MHCKRELCHDTYAKSNGIPNVSARTLSLSSTAEHSEPLHHEQNMAAVLTSSPWCLGGPDIGQQSYDEENRREQLSPAYHARHLLHKWEAFRMNVKHSSNSKLQFIR